MDEEDLSGGNDKTRVSTGYDRLDVALQGGFLAGSTIVLCAPASDEVPILQRGFLTTSPENSILICRSLSSAQAVSQPGFDNLKCLVCSEKPVQPSKNILPGSGINNLTDLNLRIFEAIDSVQPGRVAIDLVSDILLRYKALQTRKWVSELLERLRSRKITTLAVINPFMHSNEEVQAVVDLFNGNLEVVEQNVDGEMKRALRVRWMYGVDVAEKELPLSDLFPEMEGPTTKPISASGAGRTIVESWPGPSLEKEKELIQMLSHMLDSDSVHKSIQLVMGNPRFRNEDDNSLSEPARTTLLLKIMGHRPLLTLVIVHYLSGQEFQVTKGEVAKYLEGIFGRNFSRGEGNIELEELLGLLTNAGVISSDEGKMRCAFFGLHLSPSLIAQIMSKRTVTDLDIDPIELIRTKYDRSIGELIDYDQTTLPFQAARTIDSIIRSGGTLEDAIRALDLASPNLRPGIDKTTLQLRLYQVLKTFNQEIAENYIKSYPVRLSLRKDTGEIVPLTRTDLSKRLIPEYLSRLYGVEYVSKSTREKAAEIIYVAFYESPRQDQSTAEIAENSFVEELRAAVFKLYHKDLDDLLSGAPALFRNSRHHLRECQRLTGVSGQEQKMIEEIVSSTYYLLLGCLLSNKILPPPSETNDIAQNMRLLESFLETLLRGEKRESTGQKLISFVDAHIDKGEERLKKHVRRISRLLSSDKSEIKSVLPTLAPPSLSFLDEFCRKL